jgi:hypothetical protein
MLVAFASAADQSTMSSDAFRRNAMRVQAMKSALVALVAVSIMGAKCFSITDPFVVAVNVKDIKGTYTVTPGTVNFDPSCTTKNSSDYIDANFNVSGGGQLVDVIIQTHGNYAGNIQGGEVQIGATQGSLLTLATYSGPWTDFNTPQSLIQNNVTMTLNSAGVSSLLNLIQNQQSIVICHDGAFSSPAASGMSIDVTIFAQVNATP